VAGARASGDRGGRGEPVAVDRRNRPLNGTAGCVAVWISAGGIAPATNVAAQRAQAGVRLFRLRRCRPRWVKYSDEVSRHGVAQFQKLAERKPNMIFTAQGVAQFYLTLYASASADTHTTSIVRFPSGPAQ
jgi:hypothetical protein